MRTVNAEENDYAVNLVDCLVGSVTRWRSMLS